MTRNEIAEVLAGIGVLLELKGENPFKVRAYQSGARALETLAEPLETLIAEERLREVKGIGEALALKIIELHTTGRLVFYDKLKADVPAGLLEILEVPGVGPKKVRALNQRLGITDIDGLIAACREGKVASLEGFGEKTQQKILEGIANRAAYAKRHLWWDAHEVAEPILEGLRALPDVQRAEHAGSLRRGLETVGDLDFIVASETPASVMDWFCAIDGVKEVTARGETKSSVRFQSGLQADLRIVPAAQFVFALHHFTGSKDHNVQMRQRALDRGLSMSEWGLVPAGGDETVKEKVAAVAGREDAPHPQSIESEKELFAALGLHFIPPELREGVGEIEAAEKGELPELVRFEDLHGVFHNHTHASDGKNSLEEMAAAAAALGWEYLGIADHSKASFQAKGLSEERLLKQVEQIRAFNKSGKAPVHVFSGVECDILADGKLDVPEDVRVQLDCVVVSVHGSFSQSEDEMTARIIRAIEQPHVTMLGHLTGRLLLAREGYHVNFAKVIDAALANGVIIEINAHPRRLDMDWRHWRRAAEHGLKTSINPDAHNTDGLALARAGINTARKGWLTRESVINTLPLAEVKKALAGRT
ncbi:MAG TPA: DNA polymerase/3'-5' exonuclease PolX [Opitutaceae bacterium]|nr:DNA polymerase/3'-5' exonuclease PolX [Opitutaceae bacterium]